MASAYCESNTNEDDELRECAICMDVFVDRCALPCTHSFCRRCLVRHYESSRHCTVDEGQAEAVSCPTCRQIWPLLTTASLRWLLSECWLHNDEGKERSFCGQVLSASASKYSPVQCDSCGMLIVHNDEREADSVHCTLPTSELHQCIDCCQTLCSQCVVIHGRLTATKSHLVIPLILPSTASTSSTAVELYSLSCPKHEDCPCDQFCWHCRQLVCTCCSHSCEHRDHSCDDAASSCARLRTLLLTDVQSATQCRRRCGQLEADVAADKSRWLSSIQTADDKIKAAADTLRLLVDEQCSVLRDQLTDIKQMRLKRLESRLEDVQQQRARLSSLTKNLLAMVDAQSDMQVLVYAGDVHESVARCVASCPTVDAQHTVAAAVSFLPAHWSATGVGKTGRDSLIGRIEVVGGEVSAGSESRRESVEPASTSSTKSAVRAAEQHMRTDDSSLYYRDLLATLSDDHQQSSVCGLVVIADCLYVCRSHSPQLDVYDASRTTYRRQPSIRVPGLTEPTDVTGTATPRDSRLHLASTLFVSSESDGLVFRVKLTRCNGVHDLVHARWPTDDRPYSVSVNTHLLVVSRQAASISIYDVDEFRQLRRVQLPASVTCPWSAVHAAATDIDCSESLLVCHGESTANADGLLARCVSLLDAKTGTVRRRLDWFQTPTASRDSAASVMHMIAECDVDGRVGAYLVSDEQCDSVCRVDTNLTAHESLLLDASPASSVGDAEVERPRRVCVDSGRQRLLVGLDDGRVRVFSNNCVVM